MTALIPVGTRLAARRRGSGPILWAVPLAGLGLLVLVVPLVGLLAGSLDGADPLGPYRRIAGSAAYRDVLGDTVRIAGWTTAWCLLAALPVATWLTATTPRRRTLGLALVIAPLWVSTLVRAFSWIVVLGREGLVNRGLLELGLVGSPLQLLFGEGAVVVGTVHVLLPLAILPLHAALAGVDHRLGLAAAAAGAGGWHRAWRVTLPLLAPALLATGLTTAVLALGFFVTPALLGGGRVTTLALLLESVINRLADWALAGALAVVLLVVVGLAVWAVRMAARTPTAVSGGGQPVARAPGRSQGSAVLLGATAGAVVAFLLLPVLLIVPLSLSAGDGLAFPPEGWSLRWYRELGADPRWAEAARTSAVLAAQAATLAVVLAAAAAYGLSRATGRLRGLLAAQVLLPLVVPEVVVAVAAYISLARLGLLGSWTGLLAVHVVLIAPLALSVLGPAVAGVERRLEHAAWVAGCSPGRTALTVVLPLIRRQAAIAWLFAFATSVDLLVVNLFIQGLHRTMTVTLFTSLEERITPIVAAVAVLAVAAVLLPAALLQLRPRLRREVAA